MNNIFNLIDEYNTLYDMLTDPEADEQVVIDTLEGVTGEIEIKAAGLVDVINKLDMEIEACKKHKEEWAARQKVRENGRERVKKSILTVMSATGLQEIKAGDVTIKMQNAGGQLPIIINEDMTVPERFTKLTIETDKTAIRKALEAGEVLDFAKYGERSKVLKIK